MREGFEGLRTLIQDLLEYLEIVIIGASKRAEKLKSLTWFSRISLTSLFLILILSFAISVLGPQMSPFRTIINYIIIAMFLAFIISLSLVLVTYFICILIEAKDVRRNYSRIILQAIITLHSDIVKSISIEKKGEALVGVEVLKRYIRP